MPPALYVIAGPNGAGKSTFSAIILQQLTHNLMAFDFDKEAKTFYDMDKPDHEFRFHFANSKAIKLWESCLHKALERKTDFAFETNFIGDVMNIINKFKAKEFKIVLIYIGLNNTKIAQDRVNIRISNNGHFVSASTIEERYYNGLTLVKANIDRFDEVRLFDNSELVSKPVEFFRYTLDEFTILKDKVPGWANDIINRFY